MRIPRLNTTQLVTLWAILRTALGVSALVAPRHSLSMWVGRSSPSQAAVLGRALAGRDLALGVGTAATALARDPVRRWIVAGAAADATDAAATLSARKHLPRGRRDLVIAASAGSTVVACVLAARSD